VWFNWADYAGKNAELKVLIYFMVAALDFLISYIYSKKASDWYALAFP
jgi:hypothetical protein